MEQDLERSEEKVELSERFVVFYAYCAFDIVWYLSSQFQTVTPIVSGFVVWNVKFCWVILNGWIF